MPTVKKYIIIPEYKPLYAMRKCFGPPHGPLKKPCPTPIDIIGELLKQKDAITIFEVVKTSATTFSNPVQLKLDNYQLSYDEIVGKVTDGPILNDRASIPDEPKAVTESVVTEDAVSTEPVETETVTGAADTEVVNATADEEPISDDSKSDEIEPTAQPQMTRAERKAAARQNYNK